MSGEVHPLTYFEGMYAEDPDPWGFDSRPYERRKQALTLALLPEPRYRRGVEPGCANGALTRQLARRCASLVAFDPMASCIDRAQQRLSGCAGVELRVGGLPDTWPDGTGDLVVLAEVAYYLDQEAWATTAQHLESWLEPAGCLAAVHWSGQTSYPRSAIQTHEAIAALPFLRHHSHLTDQGFIADVWLRDAT